MNSVDQVVQWSEILVSGPDSELFLQGQLTQDLSLITDEAKWTLLLQPDSSVVAALFVSKITDGYSLSVPRALGEQSLARLRRFHLRVNCTLELVESSSGPFNSISDLISAGWIGENECLLSLTPQCYGTNVVSQSISFTKGCFTGQELVGRLDARGSSVPWRMVRITGPSIDRINEVVSSKGPDGPKGITSASEVNGSVVALAIAHRTLLDADVLSAFSDVTVEVDL